MDRRDTAPFDQRACGAEEPQDRLAARFMRDADLTPRDRVSEGLACRLFRGEKSRETFGPVSFAQRVADFFVGIDFSRKPLELAFIKAITCNVGNVDTEPDDHAADVLPAERFSVHVRRRPHSDMPSRIVILPINGIDRAFLSRLAFCLEERFLAAIAVGDEIAVPSGALNSQRAQMFVNSLTSRVARAAPADDGLRLAITEFDLYKTGHRFMFGDADRQAGIVVVSLHRLRPEFYGEEADQNALFQRALKESVCQLGRAIGLKGCYDARCAMHHSASVFETDNKMSHYCEQCDKRSRAERS